jgi:hypothetical protein
MRVRLMSLVSAAGFVLVVSASAQAQSKTTPCKEGTTTPVSGRGACSSHGGVDAAKLDAQKKAAKAEQKTEKKAVKASDKAVKAEEKAEKKEAKAEQKMVKCTDGSESKGGRGACSGHGGIAKPAKPAKKK